ncbi:MAG: N-acetylmuramoyl-L-alanine amidase [Candidatus Parcubacteria bacterium]|jgi:N-acetylmuramoyl-L-alanine amidase
MRFDVFVVWGLLLVLAAAWASQTPSDMLPEAVPVTPVAHALQESGYFRETVDTEALQVRYRQARQESGFLFTEAREVGQFASVIGVVRAEAAQGPVRVLVVPGHDDIYVGAQYKMLREVDLTRELAARIANELAADEGFTVVLAATDEGFVPALETFLDAEEEVIEAFIEEHKLLTTVLEPVLDITSDKNVEHNDAAAPVVRTLYGINLFANEQQFDIVLHVHFNDYPGRPAKKPGKYEGFAVYTPSLQYSNGRASLRLARHLHQALATVQTPSTLPAEGAGIIESKELIATGAFNTLQPAAVLVEYGFIYEPEIAGKSRSQTFAAMAEQTVRALQTFLTTKE